ncbi:hypothetical protein CC78DRAFT_612396 [Lojkania enalia]|uniref:J domain-containing protein n=1 Tax=Lojkania enalia TaxID=147567 RepID=A0A9P4NA50_9PLEO|nr:hypothetical protein CC78DRAFT_612396 [Didymosphaeria enalia]
MPESDRTGSIHPPAMMISIEHAQAVKKGADSRSFFGKDGRNRTRERGVYAGGQAHRSPFEAHNESDFGHRPHFIRTENLPGRVGSGFGLRNPTFLSTDRAHKSPDFHKRESVAPIMAPHRDQTRTAVAPVVHLPVSALIASVPVVRRTTPDEADKFNPYAALSDSRTAMEDEIKTAKRKLSLQYHPDRVSTKSETEKAKAEHKMREINRAWE